MSADVAFNHLSCVIQQTIGITSVTVMLVNGYLNNSPSDHTLSQLVMKSCVSSADFEKHISLFDSQILSEKLRLVFEPRICCRKHGSFHQGHVS